MNLTKKNMKKIMFLILFFAIVMWSTFNYKVLIKTIKFIFDLILPIIFGISIAFIINVPMKQIEKKIFKVNKRKHKKLIRIISLILSIVFILGILSLLMMLIIPELIDAAINITKSVPISNELFSNIIQRISDFYSEFGSEINKIDIKNIIGTNIDSINVLSYVVSFFYKIISRIIVLFVGFILSIYILVDKENIVNKLKKIMKAFLDDKTSKKIIKIFKISNNTFAKFLTGQCLDAFLAGFLFFLALSVAGIPYSIILGVMFAITALIPYIGAFITLVIGTILVAVVNPINALWYILIFFLVQQFDDNFTYPKIVGGSVGLPALISLISVIIGGSAFGFIGMLISIPIASIVYGIFNDYVNERIELKKKSK